MIYDIAILGGGSAGVGVALAALKQFPTKKIIVLEAEKLMESTSNNTLRIIHGGFRYLQSFDIPRIIESIRDQSRLLREYPDHVKLLECLMPLKARGVKSTKPVQCAIIAFQILQNVYGGAVPKPHVIKKGAVAFALQAPFGALSWWDALLVDPLGLRDALARKISSLGGMIQEQVKVESVKRRDGCFYIDAANGLKYEARSVVNTLGPNIKNITLENIGSAVDSNFLWCRGFNLVLKINTAPSPFALASETHGGRLLFQVPRGNQLSIGTWYLPGTAPVQESDIARALAEIHQAYPDLTQGKVELISVDSGILPMKGLNKGEPILFAGEKIYVDEKYIEVLSTKYTTFFSQGEKVVKKLAECGFDERL